MCDLGMSRRRREKNPASVFRIQLFVSTHLSEPHKRWRILVSLAMASGLPRMLSALRYLTMKWPLTLALSQ
jgi:hypothetical protein